MKKTKTKDNLSFDCISRKRAIERLKLNLPISDGADNSRDRHRYMQSLADIQAIRELPSVTSQDPRWIPVSERLPEKMGAYLVTLDYKEHRKGVTTLWFHGSLGWDFRVADVVIAWMPLPEPYSTG